MKTVTILLFAFMIHGSSDDLEPQWSYSLNTVQCHNATRTQHHLAIGDCHTTTCKFPDGQYYVFLDCIEPQLVQCVAYTEEGTEGQCTIENETLER